MMNFNKIYAETENKEYSQSNFCETRLRNTFTNHRPNKQHSVDQLSFIMCAPMSILDRILNPAEERNYFKLAYSTHKAIKFWVFQFLFITHFLPYVMIYELLLILPLSNVGATSKFKVSLLFSHN